MNKICQVPPTLSHLSYDMLLSNFRVDKMMLEIFEIGLTRDWF